MKKLCCKLSGLWRQAVLGLFAVLLAAAWQPVHAEASAKGIGWYSVHVDGYLALRNAQAYDASNEIGKLYTGDKVVHLESLSETDGYYFVYSYSLKQTGYVNSDYLEYEGLVQDGYREVKVEEGYLALRSAKEYDASNEIGKLYTGDSVLVLNSEDSRYWLVYSLDLLSSGYADCNYLQKTGEDGNNSYYSDNSVGGISTTLVCDMDNQIFSTRYISFLIPDSWLPGITYNYYEDRIDFYCTAVKNAPGAEDGFLCSIYRSTGSSDYSEATFLDYTDGYNYYLRQPTDFRANPNDEENCALYLSMLNDVSEVEDSLVIISE